MLDYSNKYRFYFEYSHLSYLLNEYRKKFLNSKNRKNGYNDIPKGTPIFMQRILSEFTRKINNEPLVKSVFLSEYFAGLNNIRTLFYEEFSKYQHESKQFKKINKLAEDYMVHKLYKHLLK